MRVVGARGSGDPVGRARRARAAVVVVTYRYAGRPYDFDFDFRTDATLVCTELIYKAYEPGREGRGLDLPLVEILGRPVLPANDLARLTDARFESADRPWDLVLFLDGHGRSDRAVEADAQAFRASWRRPKWSVADRD